MNHYDDLQRFKDKTRSQLKNYKDLSAQSSAEERGDWALINQLSPGRQESDLAMGGHVSSPVPKTVAPHIFSQPSTASAPVSAPASPPHTLPPLMQSVAALSPMPVHSDVAPAPESHGVEAPLSSVSITKTTVTPPSATHTFSSPLPSAVHPLPVAEEPPQAPPVARPRVVTPPPEAVNYSRLFAPKVVEPSAPDEKTNEEKTLPLKSLLERIASCR